MACPLALVTKASVSIVGSFADGALGLQYFVHTAFNVGGKGAHHSNPRLWQTEVPPPCGRPQRLQRREGDQANQMLTLKAPTHIVLTKACYVAMPVKGNREVEVRYVPGRTSVCVTHLNTSCRLPDYHVILCAYNTAS